MLFSSSSGLIVRLVRLFNLMHSGNDMSSSSPLSVSFFSVDELQICIALIDVKINSDVKNDSIYCRDTSEGHSVTRRKSILQLSSWLRQKKVSPEAACTPKIQDVFIDYCNRAFCTSCNVELLSPSQNFRG